MERFFEWTGGFAACCGAFYNSAVPLGVSLKFTGPFEDHKDPRAALDHLETRKGPIWFKYRKEFGNWAEEALSEHPSAHPDKCEIYHGAMNEIIHTGSNTHYLQPLYNHTFKKPPADRVCVFIVKDLYLYYDWYMTTPPFKGEENRVYSPEYRGKKPYTYLDYYTDIRDGYKEYLPTIRNGLGDSLIYESDYFFNQNHTEQKVPTLKLLVVDTFAKEAK